MYKTCLTLYRLLSILQLRLFIILFSGSAVFTSCTSTKNSYYFKTLQKDTTITGFVSNDFESKIKVGDNLSVIVTSLSKEEDVLFNQAAGEISSFGGNQPGFLVRPDGTILLHRLGLVKAVNYTRKEFAKHLENELLPYMKDPIVNVNYLNHKVTVLGAVSRPQILNFKEEQLSIIDVLVSSGDVSAVGKISNIMIIREDGNTKKVKHINLEDHSIFTSSWYYIQPNDIIYVLTDEEKRIKEEKKENLQRNIGYITAGVTFLILIIDRISR